MIPFGNYKIRMMEDCNQVGFILLLCHSSMRDKILICIISFIWKEIKLLFASLNLGDNSLSWLWRGWQGGHCLLMSEKGGQRFKTRLFLWEGPTLLGSKYSNDDIAPTFAWPIEWGRGLSIMVSLCLTSLRQPWVNVAAQTL